jgi:hypothetical protein
MLQHNHDFKCDSDELYEYAIRVGSLDVAKWLHAEKGMLCPEIDSVIGTTRMGHLETIKWIFAEFKCQIDWKAVIKKSYEFWHSHKVIYYLEDEANVTLEPKIALYRLAAKGDLKGLQTALSGSPDSFPWQTVADGAARGAHADIVQWIHKSGKILPRSRAVEDACEMGNFSVLKKVYEIDRTQIVSGYERGKVSVLNCILYAAMHNMSEEIKWILNSPLKDKLPSVSDMYSIGIAVPDEAYLRVLEQIAKAKAEAEANDRAVVDQVIMLNAAERGHVKVFQWLHKQRLAVTAEVAMWAARLHKVEILKAIHAIDDKSLVCTVEIANAAATSSGVWNLDVLDWMWKTCKKLPTELRDKDVKKWVEERKQS